MSISASQLTPEYIATLDSQHMRDSIAVFEQQCMEAWQEASRIDVGTHDNISHIACFAMGGSALGMDVVRSTCAHMLKVPVSIINDYTIPASVNANTFVILSSYSGTTEETLAVAESILNITSHIVVITTGGTLKSWAEKNGIPAYVYAPRFNPSNQPRMALGYSIASVFALLNKARLLDVTEEMVQQLISGIRLAQHACAELSTDNPALMLAEACTQRIPCIFSSEHLDGIMHAVTNQINENGKLCAVRFSLPEANHHFTEALVAPKHLATTTTFMLIESTLYHPRTQLRYKLTAELLTSKNFHTVSYRAQGESRFAQIGEMLVIGGWTSFYLAMLQGIDPSPIPNVDWFKHELHTRG